MKIKRTIAAIMLLASGLALAQSPAKPIGFAIQVHTTSLFGGKKVIGVEARTLKPQMEFQPGVPKCLLLKRPTGKEFEVSLTKPIEK